VAAVAGAEASSAVVESVLSSDLTPDAFDDAVEQATRAGLLGESGGRGALTFAHALIRETLLDEISAPRRVRLHWAVGNALRKKHPRELDAIAYHLAEGVLAGDTATAVDASLSAGADAHARFVPDEAIIHFDRALGTLDVTDADLPELRYRALMGVGAAALVSLDSARWSTAFTEAAELAAAHGWWELFVDAVSASSALTDIVLPVERIEPLLRVADEHVADTAGRVRLKIAWTNLLWSRADFPGAAAVAAETLELALTVDDAVAVVEAVANWLRARVGAETAPSMRATLDRVDAVVALATSRETTEHRIFGPLEPELHTGRALLALVEADRTSFDREVFALAGGEAMLSRFRVPWFAMIAAAADGRWDDALEATAELARRFPSYAVARYAHIATESEAGLDRNEDFQAALRAFDEFADGLLLNSGLIALAHRLAGEVSRAAAGLAVDESLVEEALDRLDTANAFGALVSAASELIGALHRPDWARRLVGFVADRPGEMLTSGYGFRISPADLAHAQLALALDDAGAAVSYAEQAIEDSER
jgi:hypothetical protein